MPKQSDNFLRGWCKQLRAALDEGTELGYEAAELIDESLGLLGPSGDSDDEMGGGDSEGGTPHLDGPAHDDAGRQGTLPGVAGVVLPVGSDHQKLHGVSDGLGGAGSGASAPLNVCKRK